MQRFSWAEAQLAFGPLKVGTFTNSSNEQFDAAYFENNDGSFSFIHYSEKAKDAGISSPAALKERRDDTQLYVITDEDGNDIYVCGTIGKNSHANDKTLW